MASLEHLERRLQDRLGDPATQVDHGELTVFVPADRIREVATFCRDDEELDCGHLSDVSGVHWPGGGELLEAQISTTGWPPHRLTRDRGTIEVTYHLLSMEDAHRLRLIVAVDDDEPRVPSVTDIYPTANFHEREVYDFYGVAFEGHPNLVRILMPDDWDGHPLRKDYPLGGVDTPYVGAFIEPPDERVWARDVAGAAGGDEVGE